MSNLTFAFPSKGRIREQSLAHFDAELFQQTDERALQISVKSLDDILGSQLPAAEIAHQLRLGNTHIGITGEDLAQESSGNWERYVVCLARLPFAYARLIVATPQSWVDVNSMEDLDDAAISFRKKHGRRMRFATKYPRLTRNFFSKKGLIDYKIVESLGATEAAPMSETAEAICDLTSSGETLKSNGLKELEDGTIIESQAALFASTTAVWDEGTKQDARKLLEKMNIDPACLSQLPQ